MRKTEVMTKIKRNQKGITLIALVITIIVLLILAGVAISMLSGENGILNQAANAKTETEKTSTIEQLRVGVISALTQGIGEVKTVEDLKSGLENSGVDLDENITGDKNDGYTVKTKGLRYLVLSTGEIIPIITDVSKLTTEVEEKTIYEDLTAVKTETKRAVIPKGYKVSSVSTEQNIDTGLVVIAPDKSEFVWVPVDDTTTMYETLEDGTKVGQLYDWYSLDAEGNPNKLEYSEIGYREPSVLYGIDYNGFEVDDSKYGVELSTLQNEFNVMIKYVGKAKGFYVGRYETSWNSTTNKVQSVGGEIPATAERKDTKTWYGLYEKQKLYGNEVVGSSMIWGSQWDQIMIWMKKNGYNVKSRTPKTGVSYNNSTTTGREGNVDVMNNINDLIGCRIEFTLEAYKTIYRVRRGANMLGTTYPSYRDYLRPDDSNYSYDCSSRLTLYVK